VYDETGNASNYFLPRTGDQTQFCPDVRASFLQNSITSGDAEVGGLDYRVGLSGAFRDMSFNYTLRGPVGFAATGGLWPTESYFAWRGWSTETTTNPRSTRGKPDGHDRIGDLDPSTGCDVRKRGTQDHLDYQIIAGRCGDFRNRSAAASSIHHQ